MDLNIIPVNVPADIVLMSSSAPLAFSIATPNALYNKAVKKPNSDLKGMQFILFAHESILFLSF